MLKYQLKTQLKLSKVSVIVIFCLLILTLLTTDNRGIWIYVEIIVLLIPLFLTSNALSNTYEYNREGYLFTAITPMYRQMINKFICGWLFCQSMLIIIYIIGYFQGRERNMHHLLIWVIYSTFFCIIGLTISNITKSTTIGYGSAIAYWGLSVVIGYQLNENLRLISPIVSIYLRETVFWDNLISISSIICLLILFNIWYTSKGEEIRKKMVKYLSISCMLFIVIFAIISIINTSNDAKHKKIIQNSENTAVIVLSKSPIVYQYLKNNNINYFVDNIDSKYYKNIVYITDGQMPSNIKDINIYFSNEGVQANNICVRDSNAFRVHLDNLTIFASRKWTRNQLELLLNEREGDFVAYQDTIILAKSNFEDITNIEKNLSIISPTASLHITNDNTRVVYRNIPYEKIKMISELWETSHNVMTNNFPKSIKSNTLEVVFKGDYILPNDNYYKYIIQNYKSFEGVRNGNLPLIDSICVKVMDQTFDEIEDEMLRFSLIEYYYDTVIKREIISIMDEEDLLALNFLEAELNIQDDVHRDGYINSIVERYNHIDNYSSKAKILCKYLIYQIDTEFNLLTLLENPNDISKLITSNHIIAETWKKYNTEKNVYGNSETGRRVRK